MLPFNEKKRYTIRHMKIIVTHTSPDWDAITSVWLLKRFLDGWEDADVQFVPAGGRITKLQPGVIIEQVQDKEIVHVDTGLGPLDHHQTSDKSVCGASLTWQYVRNIESVRFEKDDRWTAKAEAIDRIVKIVVANDHFQEVFWPDASADYQEFSLLGLLEGLKFQKPGQDNEYMTHGLSWLDMMVHNFENRIWAEQEIKEKGKEFNTRFGKGLAIETINGSVLKLAQKMGYVVVVRKDPRKGNVQIKARPEQAEGVNDKAESKKKLDLTLVYEQLSKMDPKATWYLHVSKKMLLNGSMKNPTMTPTRLTVEQVEKVVEKV